jgi:hypothetical protein
MLAHLLPFLPGGFHPVRDLLRCIGILVHKQAVYLVIVISSPLIE